MRRLLPIAAFALFFTVPLWAQHGGHAGFGGGGHVGGFSGHSFSGGHVNGGHFSGGMHSGASHGFSHSSRFRSSRGPFLHSANNIRLRTRGFRDHCFGFGCRAWWGWGWPWWGSYDPWSWEQDDRRFDDDYYRQYEIANEMNEQSLEQQRMLRQEEADGDQDAYAPRSSRPRAESAGEKQGSAAVPATILVFRDQRKREIQNYAIVGQTLWNFAPGRTQRIPLADLDLVATEKANDDQGVSFRVPTANEAQ